jgi:DHA3 family macrolide efflux protein-like MFS transporter
MSKLIATLKNRDFFFLWLGQIISQFGDRLGQMALIGFVYARAPGSTIEIAKILSFTIIPVFLVGPIAGAYIDRWDRRRTMYICDFIRTILVLVIPLFLFTAKSSLIMYIFVFLIFCAGRFFIPAKLSILPELVEKKDLLIANSLINITGMLAAMFGFGIAGVIVEWLGPKGGFYLDALSFFVSAFLIFLITGKVASSVKIRDLTTQIVEVFRKSIIQEIKEGVIYFIQHRDIRFTAGIMFLLFSALGSVYIVIIVFVQNTLQSITRDLGFLAMFLGSGLFVGSMVYGRFGQKLSHYKIIFVSLVLSGIMLAIFSIGLHRYPYFSVAIFLIFALGVVISPIMIAANTLVHKTSDNQMMGKTFSSLEIVMHLGFLLFMFISSILAERIPQVSILIAVSIVFVVLGFISLIYHRKIPWLD